MQIRLSIIVECLLRTRKTILTDITAFGDLQCACAHHHTRTARGPDAQVRTHNPIQPLIDPNLIIITYFVPVGGGSVLLYVDLVCPSTFLLYIGEYQL